MNPRTYRLAKLVDGWLQVAVFFIALLTGVFSHHWSGALGVIYFGVGSVQFISWLIWLGDTPRGYRSRGRKLYSAAMVLLVVFMALSLGNGLLILMVTSPFLAVGYTILTFMESRRERTESPTTPEAPTPMNG